MPRTVLRPLLPLLLVAGAAGAQGIDVILAPGACYEKMYSDAEVAANPARAARYVQVIAADPALGEGLEAGPGRAVAIVTILLRDSDQPMTDSFVCEEVDGAVACGEGDGGQFMLQGLDDGAVLFHGPSLSMETEDGYVPTVGDVQDSGYHDLRPLAPGACNS